MEYKHTIKDINNHTGMPINFIRRCLVSMKDIFSPHISKGNKNSILFNDNALVIFDKIKQLKGDNLSLPMIANKLNIPPVKLGKTIYQIPLNTTDKLDNVNLIKQLYERLLSEKDIQIEHMQNKIDGLKDKLLLLEGSPLEKTETPENIVVSLESLVRNRIKNIFG